MAGFCEQGNEILGLQKGEEILFIWATNSCLKKNNVAWSKLDKLLVGYVKLSMYVVQGPLRVSYGTPAFF